MAKPNFRRDVGATPQLSEREAADLATARRAIGKDRKRSEGGLFGMLLEMSRDGVVHFKKDSPQYEQISKLAGELEALDDTTRNYVLALPSTQEAVSGFVEETREIRSKNKIQQRAEQMFAVINSAISQYEEQQAQSLRKIVAKEGTSRQKISEAGLTPPSHSEAEHHLRVIEGGKGKHNNDEGLEEISSEFINQEPPEIPFEELALVQTDQKVLDNFSDEQIEQWLVQNDQDGEKKPLSKKEMSGLFKQLEDLFLERYKLEQHLEKYVGENKRPNFLARFVNDKYDYMVDKFQKEINDKTKEIDQLKGKAEDLDEVYHLINQKVYGVNIEASTAVVEGWLDQAEKDELLATVPQAELPKASIWRPRSAEGMSVSGGASNKEKSTGLEGSRAQMEKLRNDLAASTIFYNIQMKVRDGLGFFDFSRKNLVDKELARVGDDMKMNAETLVSFYKDNPILLVDNQEAQNELLDLNKEIRNRNTVERTKKLAERAGILAILTLVRFGAETAQTAQKHAEGDRVGISSHEKAGSVGPVSLPDRSSQTPNYTPVAPVGQPSIGTGGVSETFTPVGFSTPGMSRTEGPRVSGGGGVQENKTQNITPTTTESEPSADVHKARRVRHEKKATHGATVEARQVFQADTGNNEPSVVAPVVVAEKTKLAIEAGPMNFNIPVSMDAILKEARMSADSKYTEKGSTLMDATSNIEFFADAEHKNPLIVAINELQRIHLGIEHSANVGQARNLLRDAEKLKGNLDHLLDWNKIEPNSYVKKLARMAAILLDSDIKSLEESVPKSEASSFEEISQKLEDFSAKYNKRFSQGESDLVDLFYKISKTDNGETRKKLLQRAVDLHGVLEINGAKGVEFQSFMDEIEEASKSGKPKIPDLVFPK